MPKQSLLEQQNRKTLQRTKNHCTHAQLGQFMKNKYKTNLQNRYKNVTNQPPLLRAGSESRALPVSPTRGATKGAGGPLSPHQPGPPTTPPQAHARSRPTLLRGRNLLLVFIPSYCNMSPSKAFPGFLVCPLIKFY